MIGSEDLIFFNINLNGFSIPIQVARIFKVSSVDVVVIRGKSDEL